MTKKIIIPDFWNLHPKVRQQILEGDRDKALSMNWKPQDPDAYPSLKDLLAKLNSTQRRAALQLLTEAIAVDGFISYSRDRNFYHAGQRYYRETYTFANIVPVIDLLAGAGALIHEKQKPGGRGFQSRFRASPALHAETGNMAVVYSPLETIIMRDRDGRLVDYRDNRFSVLARKKLETLNEGLIAQTIGLDGRIIREGDAVGSSRAQIRSYRVFNRSSFDNGGRYYGSFWQNMGDRERLSINGHPALEMDYQGLHIAMLYDELGQVMPSDPYDLAEYPRDQAKIALLIAINAPTHSKAVRAIADYLREQGVGGDLYALAEKLLRVIRAKHRPIAHAFGADAGIRLMRRDSEIAEKVMLDVLRATGVAPLCVHDSFIAPITHEGELREAMQRAFPNGKTKLSFPCKTSPDFPCQMSPSFGDMFSLDPSSVYQKIILQYGTEDSAGVVPPPVPLPAGGFRVSARWLPVWRVVCGTSEIRKDDHAVEEAASAKQKS